MLSKYSGKVAMIHDWFSGEFTGGAEKVFKEIEEIIIDKDCYYEIFCLVNHLKKFLSEVLLIAFEMVIKPNS